MGLLDDLRTAPSRKPSSKRSRQDAQIVRDAWSAHRRKNWARATEEELASQDVDFGIEMDSDER
jgi:hypothetical protein